MVCPRVWIIGLSHPRHGQVKGIGDGHPTTTQIPYCRDNPLMGNHEHVAQILTMVFLIVSPQKKLMFFGLMSFIVL